MAELVLAAWLGRKRIGGWIVPVSGRVMRSGELSQKALIIVQSQHDDPIQLDRQGMTHAETIVSHP